MTRHARRWTEEDMRRLDTKPAWGRMFSDAESALAVAALNENAVTLERVRKKAEREKLERAFAWHLESLGVLQHFEQHARFHPTRKWELDFLARDAKVGVELHGAVHANGRHTRGAGFVEDRRKMNAASELGITVLEYTPEDITTGNAACQVLRLLEQRGFRRAA